MACINVQNTDNKCFLWSLLSADYPVQHGEDPHYVHHYERLEPLIDMGNVSFPVRMKDIPKIEKLNDRSINVYGLNWDSKSKRYDVIPLVITEEKKDTHTNLLYISDRQGNAHYVLIKNLSRLVGAQMSHRQHARHICDRCLHNCWTEAHLKKHEELCKKHRAQRVEYPESGTKLNFQKVDQQHPVEFFIVADIETVLKPIQTTMPNPNKSSTTKIAEHQPCASSFALVSTDPRFPPETHLFEGDGHITDMIDAMQDAGRRVTKILDVNVPHGVPKTEARRLCAEAEKCYLCEKPRDETTIYHLVSVFSPLPSPPPPPILIISFFFSALKIHRFIKNHISSSC